MEPRFPYLEVDVPAARAEEVGYALAELGSAGVEIRDDATLTRGPGEGRVRLVASFGDRAEAEAAAQALASEPELAPRVGELVGDGWRDRYKEHFGAFALTERITVAPPWEARPEAPVVLVMDPGRAFGTGLHATTALVARQLDRDRGRLSGIDLLDVGTGSGVLALAALLLGARRAVATDRDPEAVQAAADNAARNDLSARLDASTRGLDAIEGRYPYVVANIRAPVLVDMAGDLAPKLAPGGRLVLSGVLDTEAEEVRAAYAAQGLRGVAEPRLRAGPAELEAAGSATESWVALVLER